MKNTIKIPACLILVSLMISVASAAGAKRVRQTLPAEAARHTTSKITDMARRMRVESATDSLAMLGRLSVSRYDKPAEATREALFVTNGTDARLTEITIRIDYLASPADEVIHRRDVMISCDVPAGETRRLDFPSWDKLKSYHYAGGRKPKRRQSTPYSVRITPTAATFVY